MQEYEEEDPPVGRWAPPVDGVLYTMGVMMAMIAPNTAVDELAEAMGLGYHGLPQAQ